MDIAANAATVWIYVAAGAVAIVVIAAIVVFLTPLWDVVKRRIFGTEPEADVISLEGMLEEGGRPLSALVTVRKTIVDMAAEQKVNTRKLLDYVIAQAWNLGASDVHFTPTADGMTLQLRIDGLLYDLAMFSREVMASALIRLKILSRLNPYKRDVPQDGRINVDVSQSLDVRISTLPTIHGEKAVLRFLSKAGRFLTLQDLGIDDWTLERYHGLITRPQGMVLVTGPTGSGKTTTLYSSLDAVKNRTASHLNIVTIEDPVEHELPFLNQTQVNEEVGLTFAKGLRSVLRQDPNVIMVGEIRDKETVEIAVHAGLTGHLIFSSVHAESSPGVFARLLNMGIEPYILASAVSCVLGQRLMRKLCPACREEVPPSNHEIEQLGKLGVTLDPDEGPFFRSSGCARCFDLGVHGRTGIFELLVVDDVVQEELVKEVRTKEMYRAAVERGMRPLIDDGFDRARQGVVSLEELLNVISSS